MVKGEGVKWPHLKRWLRTSIFWSGSICNFWQENCGSGCQQGRALLWKSQIAWIYWVWQLKVWISSWQLLFLFAAWLALRPLSVQRAADFTWTHLKQKSAASRRQAGKAWAWELQESLENTRKSSWSWAETRRVLEKKIWETFLTKIPWETHEISGFLEISEVLAGSWGHKPRNDPADHSHQRTLLSTLITSN